MLLGGIITEAFSWRWVLLDQPTDCSSAPQSSLYAVVARAASVRAFGASFDLAGALMLTIGQMILVFGVVEAGLKGWGTFAALGPIVLGLALMLVAFGQIENRLASQPADPVQGADADR